MARYVSRPPVATERLSLTQGGNVRYALKTPYRDGNTHVIFEPEDFIARLGALVPKPRAHLTRYHGVFTPASSDGARIGRRSRAVAERGEAAAIDRQRAMPWAQLLKRVFAIDIETAANAAAARLRALAFPERKLPSIAELICNQLVPGSTPGAGTRVAFGTVLNLQVHGAR